VIVFIDSDLVVTADFLLSHARRLQQSWADRGNRLSFTYGAVINTANFEHPTQEPHKLRDLSWAYFATGNVAIDRAVLEQSGLFDTRPAVYFLSVAVFVLFLTYQVVDYRRWKR